MIDRHAAGGLPIHVVGTTAGGMTRVLMVKLIVMATTVAGASAANVFDRNACHRWELQQEKHLRKSFDGKIGLLQIVQHNTLWHMRSFDQGISSLPSAPDIDLDIADDIKALSKYGW